MTTSYAAMVKHQEAAQKRVAQLKTGHPVTGEKPRATFDVKAFLNDYEEIKRLARYGL